MNVFIALAIGLVSGVCGGLFGIGGGIIIVPAAILLLGFSQHKAQGTSLVALLLPVGLLAVMNYYRKGDLDIKLGLLIGLGFFLGAFFGSKIALGLSDVTLRRVFAGFLVLVAAQLALKK